MLVSFIGEDIIWPQICLYDLPFFWVTFSPIMSFAPAATEQRDGVSRDVSLECDSCTANIGALQ